MEEIERESVCVMGLGDRGRWERKGERGRKRGDVKEWREGGKER